MFTVKGNANLFFGECGSMVGELSRSMVPITGTGNNRGPLIEPLIFGGGISSGTGRLSG